MFRPTGCYRAPKLSRMLLPGDSLALVMCCSGTHRAVLRIAGQPEPQPVRRPRVSTGCRASARSGRDARDEHAVCIHRPARRQQTRWLITRNTPPHIATTRPLRVTTPAHDKTCLSIVSAAQVQDSNPLGSTSIDADQAHKFLGRRTDGKMGCPNRPRPDRIRHPTSPHYSKLRSRPGI
jgi:hypothetical protein